MAVSRSRNFKILPDYFNVNLFEQFCYLIIIETNHCAMDHNACYDKKVRRCRPT